MDGNLGPIPLPWEHIFFALPCLQQILSCLLLHPTSWDRKEHFGEVSCGLSFGCCRSANKLFLNCEKDLTCDGCRTAWVLTILCKKMLRNVQMHNPTCSCGTCSKSWMEKGWACPHNPWPKSWLELGCMRGNPWYWRGWIRDKHGFCFRRELPESPYAGNATPESQECHSPRMSPVTEEEGEQELA